MERADRPFERDLRARVGVLTAQINALNVELAAVVGSLDAEGGCSGPGYRSPTHWLSVNAGLARTDAARLVRVGARLDQIPTLAEAAYRGEVGLTMLDAAARVSTPENEAAVAEVVLMCSPAQSQRVLASYRRVRERHVDPDPGFDSDPDSDPSPARSAQLWWRDWIDHLGRGRIDAALDPITLEQLRLAMRALESPAGETTDEPPRSTAPHELARRIADAALAFATERAVGSAKREGFLVHVTADLGTVASVLGVQFDRKLPFGLGRQAFMTSVTGRVTRLSDAQLAEALCGARLQLLIHQDGVPLWLGNETRNATRHQRRALRSRAQSTCEFPGCGSTRYLEPHHVIFHSNGGTTSLENLVLLCWAHHHELHQGKWVIDTNGDQHFTFRDRFGDPYGQRPPPDTWDRSHPPDPDPRYPDRHVKLLDPATSKPAWGGEKLTNYALDVLVTKLLTAA